MNHEHYEEPINLYIDNGLSDRDSVEFFAHLSACGPCRQLMAASLRVRAHVSREKLVEVPVSLDARVAESIRVARAMAPDRASYASVKHPRSIYSRIGVAIQLLIAAILLVFLFSIRVTSQGDNGRPAGQSIPIGQISTIMMR